MASTSSDQTSSSSDHTPWEVFLSFRGEDTRFRFTSNLQNVLHRSGIKTFWDKSGLLAGETIIHALAQAIKESQVFVVVFSENYGDSHWCLRELADIHDMCTKMGRSAIPVFYHIKPSVVRRQTGKYSEAFEKFKSRNYDDVELQKWRDALTAVASISGFTVGDETYEGDIVNAIVARVNSLLTLQPLYVAKYPVGLVSPAEYMTSLLSSEIDIEGVITVGIHGMGGVGKTTLALEVFNRNRNGFKGSCFLANVREQSLIEEGLVHLQQQLIDDVLKCDNEKIRNIFHGKSCIRDKLSATNALVVIDDVDDMKQLEYLGPLGPGSIIIVTTRNEDLLDLIKVKARYRVNELNYAESRQLFAQHAFGGNKIIPNETLTRLSDKILDYAGGLPLALVKFGSDLFNKSCDEDYWEWFVQLLIQGSILWVEQKLLISFEGLKPGSPDLQNIFLDIACFFMGRKEEEVTKIMETCYEFISNSVELLRKRSLLRVNSEGDELVTHDLLRDMGRRIARNNSPDDEPEKHNRLWDSKHICDVLRKNKGTKVIEGIIPHNQHYQQSLEGVPLTMKTFSKMSKLRFLYLDKVNFSGSFEHTFDALRWLCWRDCHLDCLPSEFLLPKLVILEFPCSRLRTMWEVPQVFEELRSLNMSDSLNLTTTPDFAKFEYLETLNLKGCKSLEVINISSGSLPRLVSLNLCGCVKLRSLETICELKALKVLDIGHCQKLEALPTTLGNITSLEVLNAEGLVVAELPNSIGLLNKLVELKLGYNMNLKTLPGTICDLKALKILDITECERLGQFTEIPTVSKSIVTLRSLHLYSIAILPNPIENAEGFSGFTEIFEELTSIRELHLTGCNSSLLAYTFSERFLQIYSGFGHHISIYAKEFPCWITQSNNLSSKVSINLQPNMSHNFVGMILCFKPSKTYSITYSFGDSASGLIWSGKSDQCYGKALMVIVPSSIFSVRGCDDKIELTANTEINGYHLLYKTTEDGITINVEEAAISLNQ